MKELLRCRAMESMCRQRASFYPGEAWTYLAQAEMWHHRVMDLVASERPDGEPAGRVLGFTVAAAIAPVSATA
ncbi:MAG: hypothetical protein ABWY18_05915 [Tardiphaga sp.]